MATLPRLTQGHLVSAQDWNAHVDQINDNTAALENRKQPGAYYGAWTDDNAGDTNTQAIDTDDEKVMVYTNQLVTPTGMSMSNGTVTVANAGLYLVTASLQVTTNNGSLLAMWIANSSGSTSSGVKYGPVSGYRADALSATALMRLPANSPISVYAAVWQGTPAKNIWKRNGNNLVVCYLGP